MPKSTDQIHEQINELKGQLDQMIRAMNRKLVAGENTQGDRERKAALEQKIETLRADAEALKDESLRQTVAQIADIAGEIAGHSIKIIEDRLLALAPPASPRSAQ
jgi:hypothetical protein